MEERVEGEENSAAPPEPEDLQRLKDQILRLQADFENARKRWVKQQAEIQESANAGLLRDLLEIYDDFLRAEEVGQESGGGEGFAAGVKMIARRMEEFLKTYGVGPMEAVGKPFDAARHEAVAHEATDQAPESTVLQELRRGYVMNGRVLRPAVVKVAVKPELET